MSAGRENEPAPLRRNLRQRLRGLISQSVNHQGVSRIHVIVINDVVRMGSALFRDSLPQQVALPQAEIEGRRNDESFTTRLYGHFRGRRQPYIRLEPEHRRTGRADGIYLSRCRRPLRAVRIEVAQN